MPTNLYGPGDTYHQENSHVIPSLIHRFHKAKVNKLPSVTIWGSGKPKREFLHVDDMAKASIYVMNLDKIVYDEHTSSMCGHINIGNGIDITIKELAKIIKEIVNFKGKIIFDITKPDGSPRKLLNIKKINNLGFKSEIGLKEGLVKTYRAFIKN